MVRAVVREWNEDLGWGVLDCPQTPGGCWAHYSSIETPVVRRDDVWEEREYARVAVGEVVELEWEEPGQDGLAYRAVTIRRRA